MAYIFSYVLRYDDGAAPNPFWKTCTLTICKPAIRRTIRKGDWVIGTGSKNSKLNDGFEYDLSSHLVYAMRVSKIISLKKYDKFCQRKLRDKIPSWKNIDWRKRMGDCIYDYTKGKYPIIRDSVHNETNRERDLSGFNALLSNHFYYFGEKAQKIPKELIDIIKRNQGHLKIDNQDLVSKFETWITQFTPNKVLADPQLKHEFDVDIDDIQVSKCANKRKESVKDEKEVLKC